MESFVKGETTIYTTDGSDKCNKHPSLKSLLSLFRLQIKKINEKTKKLHDDGAMIKYRSRGLHRLVIEEDDEIAAAEEEGLGVCFPRQDLYLQHCL